MSTCKQPLKLRAPRHTISDRSFPHPNYPYENAAGLTYSEWLKAADQPQGSDNGLRDAWEECMDPEVVRAALED